MIILTQVRKEVSQHIWKICIFGFEANAVFLQVHQQKPVKAPLPAKARLVITTQLGTVIARCDRHASEHSPPITNKSNPRVTVSLLVCMLEGPMV